MELLDRHRTLRDILQERGPLERDEVLRIGQELLAGLRVVHEQGLVHCDVKPANVMLGPGPAKLIDFGIASPPHEGHQGDTSIGSLHFMSPEQLHGQALTPASDLFSLGAVLYEALTGRPPYPGNSPEEVSAAHAAGTVRPPSTLAAGVRGRLDAAILQSLRRDPESRFRSADAMRVALETIDDDSNDPPRDDETHVVRTGYVPPPVPARARARAERPAHRPASRAPAAPRRRSRIAWPLIGTLLVLAAAAMVGLFIIVPLLQLGQGAGPTQQPSVAATPAPTPESQTVVVPDLVGRPTAEAIQTARASGLTWRVECAQDPAQPEGIIGQEPPAGSSVARGSRFTMFSARISDCR
jgi:eukaryotic-like serine/threonine-protein kinase